MRKIKTDIIPKDVGIIGTGDTLNYPAICIFLATGFFLEKDCWFQNQTALQPATEYDLDEKEQIQSERVWWRWHYTPRDVTLKQATEEFAHLFESISRKQLGDKKIIIPLSGGIDSRTQAAALKGNRNVFSYSYGFPNGLPETRYGCSIAKAMGFEFEALTIPRGYLWDNLEQLADLNGCYSEFTHPRQMAFIDQYSDMGEIFYLGHWGDVLFDDMGVPDEMPYEQQVEVLLKKIVKKGGLELAETLWAAWGLEGRFADYLRARVEQLLSDIDIDNANARTRAFKSMYWAPRWTSTNLSIFSAARPVVLPYYHNDMCRFICTVPEQHLADRKIQLEYLKMVAPELARVPWQAQRPFNQNNHHWNKPPWNLPYRVWNKTKNTLNSVFGKPLIQRNWEIQFLGDKNDRKLREHLFENEPFSDLVPTEMVKSFYKKFTSTDPVYYSHPVSMLLTLSVFSRKFWKEKAR